MIRIHISILVTAVALVLASTTLASATEYTFSASACNPQDETAIWKHTNQGLRNDDTSTAAVFDWYWCPVGGIESTTVDVTTAKVFYKDDSSTHNIKCEMWVRATVNNTLYWSSAKTTSGTGEGSLSWTNPLNSGNSMSNVGLYSFKCALYTGWIVDNGAVLDGYQYIIGYQVDQTNS